jgi:hypothetical protein
MCQRRFYIYFFFVSSVFCMFVAKTGKLLFLKLELCYYLNQKIILIVEKKSVTQTFS